MLCDTPGSERSTALASVSRQINASAIAIHPNPNRPDFDEHDQLYIDPTECIDCGACEPACPVEAIFHQAEVPAEWKDAIAVNRDYFHAT